MPVISFRFARNIDRVLQDQVLSHLRAMAGVRSADHIDSASADLDISRMCFAESVDSSVVPTIVDELNRAGVVEGVAVEPRRGLS